MSGSVLLIALMGMSCIGCFDPETESEFIDQPDDYLRAPADEGTPPGDFYVMGEVTRPGVYNLSGPRITIKMAVAAAGNMSPPAWPEHSVLIRRVGENQEQITPIDIAKIYRGEESDILLKPGDVLAVGTFATSIHAQPSFMVSLRNKHRMTYGFGFTSGRNFPNSQEGPFGDGRDHAPHKVLGELCDGRGRFRRW